MDGPGEGSQVRNVGPPTPSTARIVPGPGTAEATEARRSWVSYPGSEHEVQTPPAVSFPGLECFPFSCHPETQQGAKSKRQGLHNRHGEREEKARNTFLSAQSNGEFAQRKHSCLIPTGLQVRFPRVPQNQTKPNQKTLTPQIFHSLLVTTTRRAEPFLGRRKKTWNKNRAPGPGLSVMFKAALG